jgi:hypothetical protein
MTALQEQLGRNCGGCLCTGWKPEVQTDTPDKVFYIMNLHITNLQLSTDMNCVSALYNIRLPVSDYGLIYQFNVKCLDIQK